MRRLLLLALLLVACGDPAGTTLPSATPATDTTAATCPELEFPVVVSDSGRPVTVEQPPQRIVSMSATHTEILYAIGAGDRIAATDLTSNYPPAALDTPKVDAFTFNAEEVLAHDPDLVIIAFDFSGELEALEGAGVTTLLLEPAPDLEETYRQFEVLGLATCTPRSARVEIRRLVDAIDDLVQGTEPPSDPLTFFHEIDETLFTANSTTFLGQLYGLFGLVNIADEAPDEFGSGFPQLSAEFILEADPDLIFLGDAAFGVTAESLAERPGWSELTAVTTGAVFELDAEISGRWGPRTDQIVAQIAQALRSIG